MNDDKTMTQALLEGESKFIHGEVVTADEVRHELMAIVVQAVIKRAKAGDVAAVEWLEAKGFVTIRMRQEG